LPNGSQNFWIGYIFTNHHTLGADEQHYTRTAGYAKQFIQQVARLRDKMHRSQGYYFYDPERATLPSLPCLC
jgi:hypothetical protein